ncbi:hypothetical protein ES708_02736 [subsurface metagenome]
MSDNPIILGIDPGTSQSAGVVLADGAIVCKAVWLPNEDVLQWLRDFPAPAVLAVEMVASYGMAIGQEVFDTCLWIGRFIEAWDARKQPWHKLYRKKGNPPFPAITMHLCKTTRAKDTNIRQALIDRFGPGKEKAIGKKASPGPLFGISGDMWSALAVAVVCQDAMARSKV